MFDIGCSNAAAELRPYGNLTFRQSPRPGERAKCSAWAVCLGYRATAIEPGTNHLMQKPARVNIAGSNPPRLTTALGSMDARIGAQEYGIFRLFSRSKEVNWISKISL